MFRLIARLFGRKPAHPSIQDLPASHPLVDDCARRLARAPEAPRRLSARLRDPTGRDPPR